MKLSDSIISSFSFHGKETEVLRSTGKGGHESSQLSGGSRPKDDGGGDDDDDFRLKWSS